MKLKLAGVLLLALILSDCGGGSSDPLTGFYSSKPYSANPHANLNCALTLYKNANPCTLEMLPLIGMETSNPSKDDIMNRVMVSDKWMGQRFSDILDLLPPDILLLFRSVTAIVISGDIRPSFYTPQTGAIYIDPNDLWLTLAEKNTISQAPDYRSTYSNGLNFVGLWRYLNADGTWAQPPSSYRTIDDLVAPLAATFYHELTHANSFLPPTVHSGIDPADTVEEAGLAAQTYNVSAILQNTLPLQSTELMALADVMYFGFSPTVEQQAYTGANIGAFMETDRANDDYAFVDYGGGDFEEDAAMLMEELMMKYHFDITREIAYTNTSSSSYCNAYIIQWGEKGRIGDTNVKEAARLVASLVLPEEDLNIFIDNLPAPTMDTNRDWCEPFEIAATLSKPKSSFGASGPSFGPTTNGIFTIDISSNMRPAHY